MDRSSDAASHGITRRELALVVRRAAELAAGEVEAQERLTEEEVVRIAAELGLSESYVRRALYELPAGAAERRTLTDRIAGAGVFTSSRVVPGDSAAMLDRLIDHFAHDEFFVVRRRRDNFASLAPPEDTMSRLARRLHGPSHDALFRCHSLEVAVRPLPEGSAHVRLEVDLSNRRGPEVATGVFGGIAVGTLAGGATAAALFVPLSTLIGPEVAIAGAMMGAGVGLWSGAAMTVRIARRRVRRMLQQARTETEGLLDRLERKEPLRAANAPWRRRLEKSLQPKPSGARRAAPPA